MDIKRNIKKAISLQAAIAAVVLSAVFFLILLENFKTYKATSSVMVITKSQLANSQQEKIIANIAILPTNLSFYDRLLKNNPEIKDFTQGESADERKESWNERIKIEPSKAGSIINVSFEAKDSNEARQVNSKIVRNLFDSVGLYYNIKEDVDVRLVDGPVVSSEINYGYLLLLISILAGYSIAFLMDKFLKSTELFLRAAYFKKSFFNPGKKSAEKKSEPADVEKSESIPDIDAVSESDTKDKELERLNEIIQQDIYPNFPEMPVSQPRKASAPDNLPIADSSFFMTETQQNQEILSEEEKPEVEESNQEQDIKREPTPEELKKRLNELLRGGK